MTPKDKIDAAIREQLEAVARDSPDWPANISVPGLTEKILKCQAFYDPQGGSVTFRDFVEQTGAQNAARTTG